MRVGHGYDVHAFGPGDHVVLGGVRISHSCGLVAHSDGDVVMHALCDALLGAAGLPDIGSLFPDSDPAHAGKSSRHFLEEVLARIGEAGFRLRNADVTIIAQAPRLANSIGAMRANLADALQAAVADVNVKATTHEGLGALGRAEGIAAHAVVLLDTLA